MTIAEYIKHKGISAAQFAKDVGVNQSTISRYINQGIEPNASIVRKIIEVSNGEIRLEDLCQAEAKAS